MTQTTISKILIANRGEIACRIARTARAMGLSTVAVFSDADRSALHVRACDEAIRIGPEEATASYLDGAAIIAAARRTNADAVHPGYGFLSENAAFAEACLAAGLVFIGPSPSAVSAMGNKAAAKERMLAAGVPCVPGYQGSDQSDDRLVSEALRIGLPVMVKAAAGGGGRGMRLVDDPGGLPEAIRGARSEAQNAFGSGELILEKAIIDGRHVEIQVFADAHGRCIHLGERDCSVQRRHQKVIEEAPSPAVSAALRARMGAAAVAAAEAIGYRGAGTVEFLLAADGSYYFLEMNTRLQVEHPVTEAVTGLDLVEWQIRIARGEPLPLTQEEVRFTGHAIEARLYAEAPALGFLPQSGTVLAWRPPSGAGIRVDHGLARADRVSPHYDPMIAKIIACGASREEARKRLARALGETVVLGLETNRGFLVDLLEHPAFAAGEATTSFIARAFGAKPDTQATADEKRKTAAAAIALLSATSVEAHGGMLSNWSSTGAATYPMRVAIGEHILSATVTATSGTSLEVELPDGRCRVKIRSLALPAAVLEIDDVQRRCAIARDGDTLHLSTDRGSLVLRDVTRETARKDGASGEKRLLAPMNGKVVRIRAKVGDEVGAGQCVVVLEAMKMQHEIVARRAGRLARVPVEVGQQVATRALLAELAE
jgi:geranyl-CoA carboxylase alpha subunit